MVYIFEKAGNLFLGLLVESKNRLQFQHNAEMRLNNNSVLENLRSILPEIRPFVIKGEETENNIIVDAVEFLSYMDVRAWGSVVSQLILCFPECYFVRASDPPDWKQMEKDMALYLSCGMLEDMERDAIVSRLVSMSEEEVLLMHHELARMAQIFETFSKAQK